MLMSVLVNVDDMVLPDMSMDFPVESCPIRSYSSSKLLLHFSMAERSVSPVPVLTPVPTLILCLLIVCIYFTENEVPHPQDDWAFGLSYVKYEPNISFL